MRLSSPQSLEPDERIALQARIDHEVIPRVYSASALDQGRLVHVRITSDRVGSQQSRIDGVDTSGRNVDDADLPQLRLA
jgi:hypothetical protein